MELQKLIYTVEDGIGIVTMNFLKNLNAIDEQMADELMYVVDKAEKDPNVKVLVIKSAGKAFSAGGDIGYFYKLIQAGGEVNMDGLIAKVGVVADGLKKMSKMVITSVSGAAAGAGVSLALGGDFMICAEDAKFLLAFVNLGIGVPLMCVNYLPKGVDIWLEAEIGTVGSGPTPSWDNADIDIIDAGGMPASIIPGGSIHDHTASFGFIRGGHIDIAVLGTLQVDQEGNIANWTIPGKLVPGMGGAMDLCSGVKRIIVATDHCEKNGAPKIVNLSHLKLLCNF